MTTQKKAPVVSADDLDQEATVGKRLVVEHKGESFEIQDLANDRPWREVARLLAAASGELGVAAIEPAMEEIVGEEQLRSTDDWSFADFLRFSQKVGERIGAAVGTPGESRGSRR